MGLPRSTYYAGLRVVPTSHSLDQSGDFERGLLDCGVKVSVS